MVDGLDYLRLKKFPKNLFIRRSHYIVVLEMLVLLALNLHVKILLKAWGCFACPSEGLD